MNKPGKSNVLHKAVKRTLVTETAAERGTSSIYRMCFNHSWDNSLPQGWCARPWKQKLQLQYSVTFPMCIQESVKDFYDSMNIRRLREFLFPHAEKKMYYSPFSSTRIHQTRDQEIFLSVIYHFHKQEGKNTSRFLGIHPWNLLGYTTAHSYISYTEMLATLVTVYLLKIIATT